jgi:hypothetical protein
VRGSTGLSGFYNVDLADPNGPRSIAFNEPALRVKRKLEEMNTVGTVFVELLQYPSSTAGMWSGLRVEDGTLGGYEWRIYFLSNPGTFNGLSFPPGSGNIDPIAVTYATGTDLLGTDVRVQSVTYTDGSVPIDGTFTLTYSNGVTDPIRYDQMPLEMKYNLQSTGTIGEVDVFSNFRMMQKLEGVYVSATKDSNLLTVEYDDNSTDVRHMLSAGDLFRVGGADDGDISGISQSGIDGAVQFGMTEVSPLSPLFGPQLPTIIYPGETLRIGADDYSVLRTGVEIQTVSVECGTSGSTGACGRFYLAFNHNGATEPALGSGKCISRIDGGEMSSAEDVEEGFNMLPNVNFGDVKVTRSENTDSTAYVFTLYFSGASVLGNVLEVVPTRCEQSLAYVPPDLYAGSMTVMTMIQGGFTEAQTVRVNVDAGYIAGGLFRLGYTSTYKDPTNNDDYTFTVRDTNLTTGCIQYGAEAFDIQSALQSMDVISSHVMPFQVEVYGSNTVLKATSSIYGIIGVGSVISLKESDDPTASSYHLTVVRILDAVTFIVNENVLQAVGTTGLYVFIVESNSVQVSRHGTGNSTAFKLVVTETADSYVPPTSGGFYRLKMTYGNRQIVSQTCLKFDAAASDFQDMINTLGFDFNGDGADFSGDNDHVTVTRTGDGSVSSGYGYAYTLLFGGPLLTFGRSDVLGYSDPTLEIMDEGHYGGCQELNSTLEDSIVTVNYKASVGLFTWYTTNTTLLNIQPGDRLRLPTSASPYKLYLVTATTAHSVTVDTALTAFDGPPADSFNMTLNVIHGSLPEYSVDIAVQGEDSYSYDVYFSGILHTNLLAHNSYLIHGSYTNHNFFYYEYFPGPHLTNVALLDPILCPSSGYQQFGGMLHSVSALTVQEGGSQEVQTITFSSRSVVSNAPVGGYWKIVTKGEYIMGSSNGGEGYIWGVLPATIESDINAAIFSEENIGARTVRVSVEGFGSIQESPKYVYTIEFTDDIPTFYFKSNGYGFYPAFSALSDGEISMPYYITSNTSFLQPKYSLDDLSVSGTFNGTTDSTYTVKISRVNKPDSNCTIVTSKLDYCIEMNEFEWCSNVGGGTECSTFQPARNITAGGVHLLSEGVSISFGNSAGHYLGDSWKFSAVRCFSPTPTGAAIVVAIERSGGPTTNQITVVPGYTGPSYGVMMAYKKAPVFVVQNQNVEVFKFEVIYVYR